MRKLHWKPSKDRDTLPALETVIVVGAVIIAGLFIYLFSKLLNS